MKLSTSASKRHGGDRETLSPTYSSEVAHSLCLSTIPLPIVNLGMKREAGVSLKPTAGRRNSFLAPGANKVFLLFYYSIQTRTVCLNQLKQYPHKRAKIIYMKHSEHYKCMT